MHHRRGGTGEQTLIVVLSGQGTPVSTQSQRAGAPSTAQKWDYVCSMCRTRRPAKDDRPGKNRNRTHNERIVRIAVASTPQSACILT